MLTAAQQEPAQLPLFGAPQQAEQQLTAEAKPLARRTDSTGSRDAARKTVASGRKDRHEAVVLEALRGHPWATSLELIAGAGHYLTAAGVDRVEVSRRLPGLLASGEVVRLDPRDNSTLRRCTVAGSPCHR